MATETVVYVSLALVLLTRIYVFISPPDFLEEHKDRRYKEYHLYRQYHLHKQYDDNDSAIAMTTAGNNETSSSTAQEPPAAPRRLSTLDEDMLLKGHRTTSGNLEMDALHHPANELVLVGVGSGTRTFSMDGLSQQGYSKHEPHTSTMDKDAMHTSRTKTRMSADGEDLLGHVSSSHSRLSSRGSSSSSSSTGHSNTNSNNNSSNTYTKNKSEQDFWNQLISSHEAESAVPSYISLNMSEIHYNGSLEPFARDPEVFESIQSLRSEPQEMGKEKWPEMTVVWEGGRWCCLEGRTLYILRALDWQGTVRVRVLVNKDPTLLAITEECWRAAGMASNSSSSLLSASSNSSNSQDRAVRRKEAVSDPYPDHTPVRTAAATTSKGTGTVGLALDNDCTTTVTMFENGVKYDEPLEVRTTGIKSRLSSLAGDIPSLPGSPGGHDADDEADETGYESDTEDDYDDDYDDEEDDEDVSDDHKVEEELARTRKSRGNVARRRGPTVDTSSFLKTRLSLSTSLRHRSMSGRALFDSDERGSDGWEEGNNSDRTIVSPVVMSPVSHMFFEGKEEDSSIRKQKSLSAIPSGGSGAVGHDADDDGCQARAEEKKVNIGMVGLGIAQMATTGVDHPLQMEQEQQHERRISVPECLLPLEAHDEQVYLVLDLNNGRPLAMKMDNPPRRDSGHGDSS
ncbi:hypothetical protein BGZ94_004404 [Podila epigama]|nr:hypothetical protein BGZ94_004404 [Podila epigama]